MPKTRSLLYQQQTPCAFIKPLVLQECINNQFLLTVHALILFHFTGKFSPRFGLEMSHEPYVSHRKREKYKIKADI